MTRRLALAAVVVVLLTGCSGYRTFGVTTTDENEVAILSVCDDVGIADIWVYDEETGELVIQLTRRAPQDDLPARVVIAATAPAHEPTVTGSLPLTGLVRIRADYPLAATLTENVVVDVAELGPDVVATTVVGDDGGLETRFQTAEAFADSRRSCLGLNIPWPIWAGFLIVFGSGFLIAAVAIWRFVRKPTPRVPVSRLPHPPSRP